MANTTKDNNVRQDAACDATLRGDGVRSTGAAVPLFYSGSAITPCVKPDYSSPADYTGPSIYSATGHTLANPCGFNVYAITSSSSSGTMFVEFTNKDVDVNVHFYDTDGSFISTEAAPLGITEVSAPWSGGTSGAKVIVQPQESTEGGSYDITISM